MKTYIKHSDPKNEYKWSCVRCGLSFTLYGPNGCYIAPNFCPNCGTVRHTGTTPYEREDDKE